MTQAEVIRADTLREQFLVGLVRGLREVAHTITLSVHY